MSTRVSPELSGFLAVVCYTVIVVAITWRAIRRTGEPLQTWFLLLIAKIYAGLFFSVRYRQHNVIPPGGSLLLVNHRSPVDPLLVAASFARDPFRGPVRIIEFLTATEYTRIPGAIGYICKHMRTIPVDRDGEDMESAKVALRRIKAGYNVGIFPEGKINTGSGLLKPIPGVAWLALKADHPVIPAFIHGAPQLKCKSMVAPFLTRTRVTVTFGPPVDLSAYKGIRTTPAILAEVSALLMQKLAEAGGLERSQLKIAGVSDRLSA